MKKRRLYHFTENEVAELIQKIGFRPGDDGFVWFATHPKECWGARGTQVVFEVVALYEQIRDFMQESIEEVWDSTKGEWIETGTLSNVMYSLPAEVANSFPRRILSYAERKKMML